MTLAQDIIVTLAMCGALAIVLRRVIGFARAKATPKCAACESGACAPASTPPASPVSPQEQTASRPLVFMRSAR